ncbi:Glutaredoxin-C3 [Diplonema papillatum]|nr:Glutaredoxin-C3 [Diplonema papillatum]
MVARDVPSKAAQARALIGGEGAKAPVLLFSKTFCQFCKRAKATLAEHGAEPFVVELDQRDDGDKLQLELEKITGQHTVPNLFINDHHIGSSTEVAAVAKSGRLDGLLNKSFTEYPN